MESIELVYNQFKNYDYIYIENIDSYNIKSPNEFKDYHGGVCYDYVVTIADQLEEEEIPYHCYYTVIHKGNKTIATHTYIIVEPNLWIECAWKLKQGLYEVDSYKDIEKELLDYYNGDSAFTVEYNPLETVGMFLSEFYDYLEKKSK